MHTEMEEVSHYLMVLMQYVQILRSLIILQKGDDSLVWDQDIEAAVVVF